MTDKLPPNLLALFAPRPQLRYLPPNDHAPEQRKTAPISGIADFVPALKEKAEKAKAAEEGQPIAEDDPEPEKPPTLSKLEERNNRISEKQEKQKWLVQEGWKELYKPRDDPNIRGDGYKTMFVGRIPYDTEVRDLEKEFSRWGPIERVRIVVNNGKHDSSKGRVGKKNKPRGYAFVVFEDGEDLKTAFKDTKHMYINGRKVVVDIERGRTTKDWKPRRFGGGFGGRHYTKENARPQGYGFGPPPGPGFRGGGFRGGHDRGGFRGGRGGGGYGGRGGGGGYGGGRGGIGYQSNGFAPDGAPRGPGGGGYGGGGGGYGGRGGGYDDRRGNANFEPLPPRGRYQDRDRDRDRDRERDRDGGGYGGHKRPYEGGYDDSRSRRRY